MISKHMVIILWALLFIPSCGGSGSKPNDPFDGGGGGGSGGDGPVIKVLMMGNSHTTPIPELLHKIFAKARPDVRLTVEQAPGYFFLIDRINQQSTFDLLESEDWTHVVLQALKYSSTGRYTYPTTGAEVLIDKTNEIGAVPIMFPEHPREGNSWESNFLYELHSGVAVEHPACVSPIGFVWEDFMNKSDLSLHHSDGNHATQAGSFLTAMVIFQTIMADEGLINIPHISGVGVNQSQQTLMRASVSDILNTFKPCALYTL